MKKDEILRAIWDLQYSPERSMRYIAMEYFRDAVRDGEDLSIAVPGLIKLVLKGIDDPIIMMRVKNVLLVIGEKGFLRTEHFDIEKIKERLSKEKSLEKRIELRNFFTALYRKISGRTIELGELTTKKFPKKDGMLRIRKRRVFR